MVKRQWPEDEDKTKYLPNVYRAEHLLGMGAEPLGPREQASAVWIRRQFSVRANL